MSVKRYQLNRDFCIECEIGAKMAVRVILVSVPFEPVIERVEGITDKNEANRVFKALAGKYSGGAGFYR